MDVKSLRPQICSCPATHILPQPPSFCPPPPHPEPDVAPTFPSPPLLQLGGYASNKAELDALVSASGKTVLLAKLLPHLQEHGHRVLVFSQFKEVLNLLEDVLDHLGLECALLHPLGISIHPRFPPFGFSPLACTRAMHRPAATRRDRLALVYPLLSSAHTFLTPRATPFLLGLEPLSSTPRRPLFFFVAQVRAPGRRHHRRRPAGGHRPVRGPWLHHARVSARHTRRGSGHHAHVGGHGHPLRSRLEPAGATSSSGSTLTRGRAAHLLPTTREGSPGSTLPPHRPAQVRDSVAPFPPYPHIPTLPASPPSSQADLQAAARCHRIGQHKPVTVYRLVSRGTYEAALYARANQKRGLEQAVIGHGDFGGRGGSRRPGGAGVSDAEIERLLRMGAQVVQAGETGPPAPQPGPHVHAAAISPAEAVAFLCQPNLPRAGRCIPAASPSPLARAGAGLCFPGPLTPPPPQVLGPGTSGDDASTRFASSSIDQLLATHAETIERDEGAAAAGGAFSQATFVSQEAAGAPDLDDPDFWQKVLPEAENGRGTQAAQHGEEGRTLRQRSGGSGWPARAEPPGSDTDDSDGLDDEEEEEGQALTGKASCPRPWRPAELRLLCASLLRGGLARVHTLVGDELQSRTAAEVHCAAEAVVALWLEGQPAAAPHRFTREQLGTAPDGPLLGVAPSLDGPVESAAPNESIPRAAPSPHGRKVRDAPPIVPGASAAADGHTAPVAPGFPANFVQKQSSVKASARGLQCLRSIAAVEEHVTAGRGVGSLRLRKRSVVAGWTADHDEALVAAAHRRGFPSARRPADDLAYWRAIAGLVQSAAPPLPGLCVAGSCAASGPGAETDGDAEPGEDGEAGEGDVPAICGSLNARLVQLCRAMLSFTHEQARDVQKEAEARERRRAEIEEKRRVRAEVEAARAAARELRQAERAAQAAVKAEAARARETARKERRAEREVEDAKSAEQKKDEKRAREAERVSSLLEQGKKVWADSREVQDLAGHRSYPPVPPTTAGKPQERNRSCHLCTQGVASWRGAFTAPLGCSRCPRIFCERCLGHINDEAVLPLAGRSVPAFLDQRWDDWVCLMCAGKCACQDEALAAKVQIASVCATSGGMCRVCTVGAHGFRAGDSVRRLPTPCLLPLPCRWITTPTCAASRKSEMSHELGFTSLLPPPGI